MRDERLIEQRQAIPYRPRAVSPRDRISIVNELKAPQALGQNARSRAVSGVDQRVRGKQLTKHDVATAAVKRIAEHEHIAAAQPGHRNPGQLAAKTPLLSEVVAQVELDGVEAKVSQRGELQLDASAAHIWRRIIHGVGDDHHAAAVLTDQGDQMFWMIT